MVWILEPTSEAMLLLRNAQKDHRDVFGCSALHVAAHNGHSKACFVVLKKG